MEPPKSALREDRGRGTELAALQTTCLGKALSLVSIDCG